ncbi:MAG: hypothetical protein JXA42_00210 [Anaerolineales bacterium]|nr:hypothetical protein [Anaerolineales bacterium]
MHRFQAMRAQRKFIIIILYIIRLAAKFRAAPLVIRFIEFRNSLSISNQLEYDFLLSEES